MVVYKNLGAIAELRFDENKENHNIALKNVSIAIDILHIVCEIIEVRPKGL